MRTITLSLPAFLFIACGGTEPTPEPLPDPVLTLGPEAPCTNQDLVASLQDGTAAAWRWTVGGQPAEVDGSTVPASMTEKGQRWRVAVDVEETGTTLTGDLSVVNCAPTINGVTLTPDAPTGLDILTANVDVEDPDGDLVTLRYRWLVRDEEVFAGSSGRTEFTRSLEGLGRGAVVALEVIATDGVLESDAETASTELVNTPPSAPVVQIDPDGALIDDDLVCRVIEPSTDIDGDEVSYTFSWTVNGSAFTDTGTTEHPGDTVLSAATNDQDVWQCSAVASDGEGTSEAATHEVVVVSWTGPRMFSTCGATGRNGPSESTCIAAYGGTTLADDTLSVDRGVQQWVVPRTGRYRIEAQGARGGGSGSAYGRGTRMRGTFELEEGEVINILVGQQANAWQSGGGGGGTFVVRADNTPLIVAGGGGGQYTPSSSRHNADATLEQNGMGTGCTSGGTSGAGGSGCTSNGASGGGGLTSDGGRGSYGTGGLSFLNGGVGGNNSSYSESDGAFGGGGGTHGNTGGGGGGGGYSGGAGGFHNSGTGSGGGGGSYNAGEDQENTAGVGDGDGHVTIDRE